MFRAQSWCAQISAESQTEKKIANGMWHHLPISAGSIGAGANVSKQLSFVDFSSDLYVL